MNLKCPRWNSEKGVHRVFHLWIMVEEMVSLPGVKGVNGVKGVILLFGCQKMIELKVP